MISTRLFTIFVSLVLSYLVLAPANDIGLVIEEETFYDSLVGSIGKAVVGVLGLTVGFYLAVKAMLLFHSFDRITAQSTFQRKDDEKLAYFAGGAAIVLSATFGAMAMPFANFGAWPWQWYPSSWFVLYVVAFVPLAYTILDLCHDMFKGSVFKTLWSRVLPGKSSNVVPIPMSGHRPRAG